MRLTYLDILEQCFHDKFRGYNKQEVDTFLHLVADDFKSMAEDIKGKDRQTDLKNEEIRELQQSQDELAQQQSETTTSHEVEEELRALRKELEEKNNLIQQMETATENQSNRNSAFSQLTPEMLKEKAKKIINTAKKHAEQHKASAAKELNSLQIDIQKLQLQKQQLMENIRTTAVEHLNKFKAGTQNGNAGNSVQD
jgi:DivIVA domain-containing protein